MEWYLYPILIAAGIVAGFINTVAGSGSLITLPLLMFIGLPANIANATNRVGILLQSAVGSAGFRQKDVFRFREGLWLALPATAGSLIGAIAAVKINTRAMEIIIGILLFFMFFIVLYKPEKWITEKERVIDTRPKFWQLAIFFLIGLYGGFIQVGVGFLLLAGLVFGTGVNITKANALKVLIVFVYTIAAVMVFIFSKQINYPLALTLAAGSMIGAWLATRFALKHGPAIVRIVLLVTVFASAFYYTGLARLLINLMR
ncbi:MAG: sulfite exporter TauE/SafE family protein [Bacteroidales bacterium]